MRWRGLLKRSLSRQRDYLAGLLLCLLFSVWAASCQQDAFPQLDRRLPLSARSDGDADPASTLRQSIEAILIQDGAGQTISLVGYEVNRTLFAGRDYISTSILTNTALGNEALFSFVAPENLVTEYSQPLVTSASGASLDDESKLTYYPAPPSLDKLLSILEQAGWCGQLRVDFKMRLSLLNAQPSDPQAEVLTPQFTVEVPCSADTFAEASIKVVASTEATSASAVDLRLSAGKYVTAMYLTSTAGCKAGGTWEAFSSSKSNWPLALPNTTNHIYVAYRDLFGQVSECLSVAIDHDNTAPQAPTILINGGAATTSLAAVTLTLSAEDHQGIEMYITNTPACADGGDWEAFTPSLFWILAQTNAQASVYARFRDSLGNLSACVTATILHHPAP